MSANNQTFGTHQNRIAYWRLYEALPPLLRRLLQRAPYNYRSDHKELLSASAFVAKVFRDRDNEIRKAYGPDHPMIGERRASRV